MIHLYGNRNCDESSESKALLFKKTNCFIYYPLDNGIDEAISKHNLSELYRGRSTPLLVDFSLNREKLLKEDICEVNEIEIGGLEDLKSYLKNYNIKKT